MTSLLACEEPTDLVVLHGLVSSLLALPMRDLHEEPDRQRFSDVDPVVLVLECGRYEVQVVLYSNRLHRFRQSMDQREVCDSLSIDRRNCDRTLSACCNAR